MILGLGYIEAVEFGKWAKIFEGRLGFLGELKTLTNDIKDLDGSGLFCTRDCKVINLAKHQYGFTIECGPINALVMGG